MVTKIYEWHECVNSVSRFVVKVHTQSVWGTGFLFCRSKKGGLIGIATAKHVVDFAKTWNQPIQIQHEGSNELKFFAPQARGIIIPDIKRDLAAIVVREDSLNFCGELPDFLEGGKRKRNGVELGWLGYPSVASLQLCFFSGHVSSYLSDEQAYLIDGVAMSGVSGGPVFDQFQEVTGLVTHYIPTVVSSGQVLPGLCLVYNVEPFRVMIEGFKSIDEAKEVEQQAQDPSNNPGQAA